MLWNTANSLLGARLQQNVLASSSITPKIDQHTNLHLSQQFKCNEQFQLKQIYIQCYLECIYIHLYIYISSITSISSFIELPTNNFLRYSYFPNEYLQYFKNIFNIYFF